MVLDIIAVAIIVFCVFKGIKNGLVKALFGTAALILALVLTSLTANPVSEYIKDTPFGETVYEKTKIEILDAEDFEFPGNFLDEEEFSKINIGEKTTKEVNALEEELSLSIGDAVISSLCSFVLFALYFVAFKIVARLLDAVCKLPLLKTFNKAGGFIAGSVNAYITLLVFGCVIMILLSTDAGAYITKQLSESFIASWIYQNNILI